MFYLVLVWFGWFGLILLFFGGFVFPFDILAYFGLVGWVCWNFLIFSLGEPCRDEGGIWKYWEMNGVRVHAVKFSKIQCLGPWLESPNF